MAEKQLSKEGLQYIINVINSKADKTDLTEGIETQSKLIEELLNTLTTFIESFAEDGSIEVDYDNDFGTFYI